MKNSGISSIKLKRAQNEIKDILIKRAKARNIIFYSDLVKEDISVIFEPRDPRLDEILDNISTEEDREGRGMLSVVVVHASGDKKPGQGFFDLAKELGRNFSNYDVFWIEETKPPSSRRRGVYSESI